MHALQIAAPCWVTAIHQRHARCAGSSNRLLAGLQGKLLCVLMTFVSLCSAAADGPQVPGQRAPIVTITTPTMRIEAKQRQPTKPAQVRWGSYTAAAACLELGTGQGVAAGHCPSPHPQPLLLLPSIA